MFLAAVALALFVSVPLTMHAWKSFHATLGDTDDATRLTLMRGLLQGTGWWDQRMTRFQPPQGVFMHWSRLVDGGLAAMTWLFSLVPSPWKAEDMTRLVWPLLWIIPAALAALSLARRFGGGGAVLAAVLVMGVDLGLYNQFRPGRIDHHDLQITFCMIALAAACREDRGRRGGIVAGLATGLGLAVGLEALAFDVLIGASFGLRLLLDRKDGRAAGGYGLSLAATSAAAFLVQTPPARWATPACDALGSNLALALPVAGLGLALAARLTAGRNWPARLLALGLTAVAALAVYLGLDPGCVRGPFADVDARIRPIWLDHVQEVTPLSRLFKKAPDEAIVILAPFILGSLSWLWLGRRPELRRSIAWPLAGLCLAASMVSGAAAIRMSYFAEWIAAPLIAAAAVDLARRYLEGAMLATAALAVFLSPGIVGGGASAAYLQLAPKKAVRKRAPDYCANRASYGTLAKAGPPGLVIGEIDLGPFVLAHTPHSAMAAPYHRMSWGILAGRGVLAGGAEDAGPGGAQARARALGATYVIDCAVRRGNTYRDHMGADALLKRLDAARPPTWLEPLSRPKEPLQVYRLRPAG